MRVLCQLRAINHPLSRKDAYGSQVQVFKRMPLSPPSPRKRQVKSQIWEYVKAFTVSNIGKYFIFTRHKAGGTRLISAWTAALEDANGNSWTSMRWMALLTNHPGPALRRTISFGLLPASMLRDHLSPLWMIRKMAKSASIRGNPQCLKIADIHLQPHQSLKWEKALATVLNEGSKTTMTRLMYDFTKFLTYPFRVMMPKGLTTWGVLGLLLQPEIQQNILPSNIPNPW
jgi:hypothetical protein